MPELTWQELLEQLVDAHEAINEPNARFRVTRLGNRTGAMIRHPGVRWDRVPRASLEELRERGLIRVEVRMQPAPGGRRVEEWFFDITEAGLLQAEQARRARRIPELEGELRETWAERELPILRVALRELDTGKPYVELEDIRAELGLSGDDVWAAVHALGDATPPYITFEIRNGWRPDHAAGTIDAISERARRELGTWPSAEGLVGELAAALREAADRETEPEARGRLRTAAEALAGFARDVAVAAVARHVGS